MMCAEATREVLFHALIDCPSRISLDSTRESLASSDKVARGHAVYTVKSFVLPAECQALVEGALACIEREAAEDEAEGLYWPDEARTLATGVALCERLPVLDKLPVLHKLCDQLIRCVHETACTPHAHRLSTACVPAVRGAHSVRGEPCYLGLWL